MQEPLAGRAARDVESNIAFEVVLEKSLDDFGRGCFGGLVIPSRAFVKEANNSLDEGAEDQDELSFGVVRKFEDYDSVDE